MHDIEHWLRVLINGRLIAAQSGADIEVVEHFALLHDVQRKDEYRDMQHGNRAADFAASIIGDWVLLNSTQMYQLTEACRYHSTVRMISSFSEAGYLIPDPPQALSCFF